MAYQPESGTYPTGVYQWETTDQVLAGVGGIANKPLLDLANRTAWLKANIDAVLAGGVASFNTRTGAITLVSADIAEALGFTPAAPNVGLAFGWTNGLLPAAQPISNPAMVFPVTLPAGLAGSVAICDVAPTAPVQMTIYLNASVIGGAFTGGTAIGTVNFAAGATTGTFTFAGALTLNPGDRLGLGAPATSDTTFANPSITFLGSR
jgi:hypothetical protein